jgi:hypothetical protein
MPTFKWLIRIELNDDGRPKTVWVTTIYNTAQAALDDIRTLQLDGVRGLHLSKWSGVASKQFGTQWKHMCLSDVGSGTIA